MSGLQKKAGSPPILEAVPPYYFRHGQSLPRNTARGALTEGKAIGQAFTVLLDEARTVQYIMLRIWISKTWSLDFDTSSLHGFSNEQHGTVGYALDELVEDFFDGDPANILKLERLGVTLRRACGLSWVATVPRSCTDEEAASGCDGCGARALSIKEAAEVDGVLNERKAKSMSAELLVAESWEWCRRELGRTPTKDEVRKFRVDRLWLPDLTDAQTIKHYKKNPLPAWYQNGVVRERFEASGPDDARYPSNTLAAVEVVPNDTETWYAQWADEFTAEVGACCERFEKNHELPHELARLIDAVKSFQFGESEAGASVERLKGKARGKRILEVMQTGRARLARQLSALQHNEGKTATAENRPPLKALHERFRSSEQFHRFIELLKEHEIVDATGTFLPRHGNKGRLLGAYEGASENSAVRFRKGVDAEIVATLNNAFSTYRLSAARPQDLKGTKGHDAMLSAFKTASFPP